MKISLKVLTTPCAKILWVPSEILSGAFAWPRAGPKSSRCPYMLWHRSLWEDLWRSCLNPPQEVLALRSWRSSALVSVWKIWAPLIIDLHKRSSGCSCDYVQPHLLLFHSYWCLYRVHWLPPPHTVWDLLPAYFSRCSPPHCLKPRSRIIFQQFVQKNDAPVVTLKDVAPDDQVRNDRQIVKSVWPKINWSMVFQEPTNGEHRFFSANDLFLHVGQAEKKIIETRGTIQVLASTPGLQSVPSGTKYDIGLRLSWQDFRSFGCCFIAHWLRWKPPQQTHKHKDVKPRTITNMSLRMCPIPTCS